MAVQEQVAALTAKAYESGQVIGAVCHGPAGLLPIKLSSGKSLLDQKNITGFTREEEAEMETLSKIPFLLEEALTRAAGSYTKKAPWVEHVIVNGSIVTGQNPQSAHAVGQAMVKMMNSRKS